MLTSSSQHSKCSAYIGDEALSCWNVSICHSMLRPLYSDSISLITFCWLQAQLQCQHSSLSNTSHWCISCFRWRRWLIPAVSPRGGFWSPALGCVCSPLSTLVPGADICQTMIKDTISQSSSDSADDSVYRALNTRHQMSPDSLCWCECRYKTGWRKSQIYQYTTLDLLVIHYLLNKFHYAVWNNEADT